MAKPYPKEFRNDVVAVARKGQAPLTQIAKDFGISEGSLANWMKQADVEGQRPAEWWASRLILGAYAPLSMAATASVSLMASSAV